LRSLSFHKHHFPHVRPRVILCLWLAIFFQFSSLLPCGVFAPCVSATSAPFSRSTLFFLSPAVVKRVFVWTPIHGAFGDFIFPSPSGFYLVTPLPKVGSQISFALHSNPNFRLPDCSLSAFRLLLPRLLLFSIFLPMIRLTFFFLDSSTHRLGGFCFGLPPSVFLLPKSPCPDFFPLLTSPFSPPPRS